MNGKMYADKANYIRGLNTALAPMQDFDSIKYARTITGEEFIKIADNIGGCIFIDVTGSDKSDILKDVAKVVLVNELDATHLPAGTIVDKAKMREIAPLF